MITSTRAPSGTLLLAGALGALLLSACGGGNGGSSSSSAAAPPPVAAPLMVSDSSTSALKVGGIVTPPIAPIDPIGTPVGVTGVTLTTLQIVDKAAAAQTAVPVTFGQVFAKGALPANGSLSTVYNGSALPLQVNVKATHADGSARHAVVSAILPQLNAGQTAPLPLITTPTGTPMPVVTPGQVLGGFDAAVNLNIGGVVYTASAANRLKLGQYTTWLSGPLVNEWLVTSPLSTSSAADHPHLSARFAIRHYNGGKIRVDVTIENNWAYEPNPQNVTYDAEVLVNRQRVYAKPALTHYHHARWRKLFWAGDEPKVAVKHDKAYLIATQALPNYDQSVVISQTALTTMKKTWDAGNTGPMGQAMVNNYMPSTGGRPDIGLHHAWAALYVLSQDERAKEVTLGMGDLAGSWPVHYRDRNTDQPVSIVSYPYVRTFRVSSDSYNPVTKKYEDLPVCTAAGNCATPFTPDNAHQPSFAFVPYLVTGDQYYLDELMFWANWNVLQMNPGYRNHGKGIVARDQVRSQAWTLRTLAYAAYITPDAHPLKNYFGQQLDNNLEFYNATFTASATNQLGFIDNTATSYALAYPGPDGAQTGVAPWMDDFFTSAVGHVLELGYAKAKPILDWKARFPVGRMTAPGVCWIDAAAYTIFVRPGTTAPYFTSFADAYKATMRTSTGGVMLNSTGQAYLDQACGSQAQADWRTQADRDGRVARNAWTAGEMTGFATSPTGYPSNMQPALAMAGTTGIPNAQAAWARFASRSIKPNYGGEPQFAIVPR